MKDQETKERFIQLRAEGMSFNNISKKLKISKTTLIKWSQEFDREINNLQYLAYQSLIEQYKVTKQEKINFLIKELHKIYEALSQKDYKELSVKDLIFIKERFENDLKNELVNKSYRTGEYIEVDYNNIIDLSGDREITIDLE